MTTREKLLDLQTRMQKNVTENILPFWLTHMVDDENGGFWGMVDDDLNPVKNAPKAVVLNCRMLWTYSEAYRVLGDEQCARMAQRAFNYVSEHFWDKDLGGVYWMINYKGVPLELEKRTYGQAFIIYSMAEYYMAFKDPKALDLAMETFRLVNQHVKYENGGYADSVQRDWNKDFWVWRWVMNALGAPKLLNSHLHLFEATITLYEATQSPEVGNVLKEFLLFLLNVAFDTNLHHLKAGMDEEGNRIDNEISFGHDSECSYLLVQAAQLLGEPELLKRAQGTALDIMDHVYAEGLDPVYGGMYNEKDAVSGHVDKAKIWWVQAEGITAFMNCFQITGDEKYLDAAISIWNYTDKYVVDHEKGEWLAVGIEPGRSEETIASGLNCIRMCAGKASKPKCPYHNSRTCFEIMRRADECLQ